MAINHGPLDSALDKRDDRQLDTKQAMIDVATSHGQEAKPWKHLVTCQSVCLVAFRGELFMCISRSLYALVTHEKAITVKFTVFRNVTPSNLVR
jgi:hypothetical protein